MGALRVVLLLSGIVLAFTATQNEHHLEVKVDNDVAETESIDINYERKYVKISSPKQQGTQSGSLLHDYTQGVNVLKQHGECFILDKFDDVPQDIKDWERVESSVASDIAPGNNGGRRVHYGYHALPYLVNRTTSPASVQEFCPGPIRVVVLDEKESRDDVKNDGSDDDDDEEDDDDSESSEPLGEVSDNEEELPTEIVIPDAPVAPEDEPKDREKRGWGRRRRRRRRFWRRVGRFLGRVARNIRVSVTCQSGQGCTTRAGLGKKRR